MKKALYIILLLAAAPAWAASFDCAKARTQVEKLICADSDLSRLDEMLATHYQAARDAVSDPGALKSEQLEWLKERNRCDSVACLSMRYRERIARLKQLAGESAEPSGDPRYRLVAGMGYSICETFLKHLNALPTEAPPMVCNIRPNPAYNQVTRDDWDITQPEWEELDVQENLHLIYAAELQNPPYYKYQYKYRKPPEPFPTFEEWKAGFDARIAAGKIHPRLYRTRLALNEEGGVETLIGYEPVPEQCEGDLPKYDWATRSDGKHIFVLNDDPEEPVKTIHGLTGSNVLLTALIYRGGPHFFWGGDRWPKEGVYGNINPLTGYTV